MLFSSWLLPHSFRVLFSSLHSLFFALFSLLSQTKTRPLRQARGSRPQRGLWEGIIGISEGVHWWLLYSRIYQVREKTPCRECNSAEGNLALLSCTLANSEYTVRNNPRTTSDLENDSPAILIEQSRYFDELSAPRLGILRIFKHFSGFEFILFPIVVYVRPAVSNANRLVANN